MKAAYNFIRGLEFIGSGYYCEAYRKGDTVYLLTRGDMAKEILCGANHPNLPKVGKVMDHLYEMPYYRKVMGELAERIEKISDECWALEYDNGTELLYQQFPEYKEVLDEIMRLTSSYKGFTWDIDVHNFSLDDKGNLIFRDVFQIERDI